MKTEGQIEIHRPIEQVFRLTNEHVPDWSLVVSEEQVIEETADRVGTTFRTITEDRGRRMEFEGVVTHYDPPHASAVRLTGDMFDIDVQYSFTALPDGWTRVMQRSTVTAKGITKVIMTLFGWLMVKSNCRALQQELENLRQFCESHTEDS